MSDTEKTEAMGEEDSPIVKCAEIQELLLDYSARELGESRSALVREHLLYCEACKNAFSEIMDTVSLLEGASTPSDELPSILTEKHRARVIRALTHPILDWIVVHHKLVASIIAIIVLACTVVALHKMKMFKVEKKPDMGYEIYLRRPPASARTNGGPIIIWRSDNDSAE